MALHGSVYKRCMMPDKEVENKLVRKWKTIQRIARQNGVEPETHPLFQPRKKAKVIAFKHQMTESFPIEFDLDDWHIINFKDRNKWKTDYYFQVNVDKYIEDGDEAYSYIANSGRPYMVCELSCFRKNSYVGDKDNWYYTLGWFHFLRQGFFANDRCPDDRWKRISQEQNIQIQPWITKRRDERKYALICLQKVNDSTLLPMHETFGKYRNWISIVINQIRNQYPKIPIVIRPHLRTKENNWKKAIAGYQNVTVSDTWEDRSFYEGGDGLQKDLAGAKFVVSYNSNVLTECAIQGIPAVCWDIRSMAAPLCLDPYEMSNLNLVHDIQREPYLHRLAYTQWTRKEIRSGTAWEHLRKYNF